MIKQSEISNFLDLIKHIAQTKGQTKISSKNKNMNTRYQNYDQKSYEDLYKQSVDTSENDIGCRSTNAYQHRKLRGFFEKKRNHRSFKLDNPSFQNSIEVDMALSNTSSNIRERKNLYELYCQEIQKKRQQKFKSTLFGKMSKQNSIKSNWEDEIVAELQKRKQVKSLHRQKSMPPIGKNKPLKGLVDNQKIKRADLKHRSRKCSSKKVQPFELNIGTIGEFRMPKISKNSTHISQLKSTVGKLEKSRKVKINKNHDLSGWGQEDDNNKFFHADLF